MSKKTLNLIELNTETERAYKARKVQAYVYQPASELPDAEARAHAARTALDLLTKTAEPGYEDMQRATGERLLFALAQLQIEEMEAIEPKLCKGRAATREVLVAIDKAKGSSFESHTGRPLLPWSIPHKVPGFFKARTDTAFQAFMLSVGIKRGKVTPDLRRSVKNAVAKAKRQSLDILDLDLGGAG
jgi:hypothetical protein